MSKSDGGADWTPVASVSAAGGTLIVTPEDNTTYVMPTNDAIRLYAVWRANETTRYYVERWGISGDGDIFPLLQDGTVPFDGNTLVVHDAEWAVTQRLEYWGITDEEAWADEDVAGSRVR